jgi:hypothetical protein
MQERLNQFYNEQYGQYKEQWTDKACELIAHAYALGLNENWVVAKLENCEIVEIHKAIIIKCRNKLDFGNFKEEDKPIIERIMFENKSLLFQKLNDDIFNYCIR